MKNLPRELREERQAIYYKRDNTAPMYSLQSIDDIMEIVMEARTPPPSTTPVPGFGWTEEDEEGEVENKDEKQEEEEDDEDEYDKRVKEVHASGEYQLS